jgi:hypothetical protein
MHPGDKRQHTHNGSSTVDDTNVHDNLQKKDEKKPPF